MIINSFRKFLALSVMIGMIFVLAIPAFASDAPPGTINGNNSFNTAHVIGYWQYTNIGTAFLSEDENESYFTFTANAGDRVYVRSTYRPEYTGMKIEIFDKNQMPIDNGSRVIDPTSLTPFIYANADATSNSEKFYVRVSRGSNTENMYFSLSIENRIKSGSGKYNFTGTATNNGNTNLNLNGVESSVITMDLTNNTTIPKYAFVKSITTASTQSPSQGNVNHMVMSSQNNVWNTSIVSSATSGLYNISLQNNLYVANKWSFKYNAKATAKSTMTNVSATINYEYDLTKQF